MLILSLLFTYSMSQASSASPYIDSYLADAFQGRRDYCNLVLDKKDAPACLKKIEKHINSINECDSDPSRFNETALIYKKRFIDLLSTSGEVPVPDFIQKIFTKLTVGVAVLFPETSKLNWQLRAYDDQIKNGQSGITGELLISSALWQGSSPLSNNEIAALLAHEISHTIKKDTLKLGCLALAWAYTDDISLTEATDRFYEDFQTGYPKKNAWDKFSNNFELVADNNAIIILKFLKIRPEALAEMLEKIQPKTENGFNPGSHPEMKYRIERAKLLAKEL